jgi:surface polysaccharide O-acyltransferase-like enzyme
MKPSVFETPTENLYYKGDHEIVSLQVLKALAAFAVVLIHTNLIWKGAFVPVYCNAVPLFFMITGYFLLNRDGILTEERLKRSIIKLLKLTFIAQCLFVVFYLIVDPSVIEAFRVHTIKRVVLFLAVGHNVAPHLWYLTAIIEALVTFYVALRFKLLRFMPILVVLGIGLNLIAGCYSKLWLCQQLPRILSRNFLTIGIPCVYLGMLVRRFEHRLFISQKSLLLTLVVLCLIAYLEFILVFHRVKWGDVYFLTIPTTIVTFIWVLRSNLFNKLAWLASIGRKDSLNIYILHWLVMDILRLTPYDYSRIEWIEVSILTLLLSITIRKSQSLLKIGVAKLKSR